MTEKTIAIIGGGPAGLMAADVLAGHGHRVTVYEAMPTVGRKFLLAGKSGLNITHSEDYQHFVTRFGAANARLRAALDAFTPQDVRNWAQSLGTETFVGSSGRVFPTVMKASPLLRAFVRHLESRGVEILTRHRWTGFAGGGYRFETPNGEKIITPDAMILALGGASWPRLGSDAQWVPWLKEAGVPVADFRPANCGFDVEWSEVFRNRFAGQPVKSVTITSANGTTQGEFVISRHGVEGSLIYAHASALRDALERDGQAALMLDLAPGKSRERLAADLARQPQKASFSNRLRKAVPLDNVKVGLFRETIPDIAAMDFVNIASFIKALPVQVTRPRPLAEAISSAGGIVWDAVGNDYMLINAPGVFVAGEMLDWEAPTGGYLLTACFATGRASAASVLQWLHT